MKRLALLAIAWLIVPVFWGCSSLETLALFNKSVEEPLPEEPHTRLVGDIAVPTGLQPVRVEAVGLVTGLAGTGSDPSPSPQRAALLEEMQTRGVANPNALLASGNVSLVLIQGWLRPGIQKGDRFDVEVRTPSQSETTSLRGGYLLEARLTETAVLGNRLHHGHLLATAKGPVLVDPAADPKKDRLLLCRGRVLGGGVALKSRPLGLVLMPGHQNVRNSAQVANAINRRFHVFQDGVKTGMATAKTDEYIELLLHPRYKDNVNRYIQVVRALPLSEAAQERMRRIGVLKQRLLDPKTAAEAALQLEAIGSEGVEPLLKALASENLEVRFYAAEALAYLDRREAAEPLGRIARDEPAFRVFALTALSAMHDVAAYDQLRELLSVSSAETRYGAFRALWAMDEKAPLVRGELLGGQFHYHVLDVGGPPMVHVTRNRLAEVVVFGKDVKLFTPLAISAGNEIMITCHDSSEEITVSKYTVAEGDQKRVVSNALDEVIRAVVELGGTYPDVVQALQEAKNCGTLAARFEVDALPQAGRTYQRTTARGNKSQETVAAQTEAEKIAPPHEAPELFQQKDPNYEALDSSAAKGDAEKPSADAPAAAKKGLVNKLLDR